jgi:hypothetical protein
MRTGNVLPLWKIWKMKNDFTNDKNGITSDFYE